MITDIGLLLLVVVLFMKMEWCETQIKALKNRIHDLENK